MTNLLKEALNALNSAPKFALNSDTYSNSYKLAAAITQELNNVKAISLHGNSNN